MPVPSTIDQGVEGVAERGARILLGGPRPSSDSRPGPRASPRFLSAAAPEIGGQARRPGSRSPPHRHERPRRRTGRRSGARWPCPARALSAVAREPAHHGREHGRDDRGCERRAGTMVCVRASSHTAPTRNAATPTSSQAHPAEVSSATGEPSNTAGKRARLDFDHITVCDIAVRARVVLAVSMTAKSSPDHDRVYLLNNRRLRLVLQGASHRGSYGASPRWHEIALPVTANRRSRSASTRSIVPATRPHAAATKRTHVDVGDARISATPSPASSVPARMLSRLRRRPSED